MANIDIVLVSTYWVAMVQAANCYVIKAHQLKDVVQDRLQVRYAAEDDVQICFYSLVMC